MNYLYSRATYFNYRIVDLITLELTIYDNMYSFINEAFDDHSPRVISLNETEV